MKCLRVIASIILYTLLAFNGYCQTKIIDQLKNNIATATGNKEKINAIFALCELGYTLHPDTLMYYADAAKKITQETGDKNAEIQSMFYTSGALTTKGLLDSSLALANLGLQMLSKERKNPILEANFYNQKGRCFVRSNQYKEAIEMGLQTIATAEKNNDVLLQIKGKTLIGWAYLEMGQLKDALSWHLKALHTTTDTLLLEKYAILFANLATNYNGLGKPDSAFYYINKGIKYSRKHENLFALSNSLAIASELYVKNGQEKLSEPILKEVIEIRKIIGDPFYIASDMAQLGFYYAHYGAPEKGIAICQEGIAIAKKYKLDTKLFFLYGSLADNYKAMGNTAKYATVLEDIIALKDSVYLKNSAAALAEIQTRYETEKNENIIAQQKLALVKKNYWIYGAIGSMLLIFTILITSFNYSRKKQALKNELLLKEEKYQSEQAVTIAQEKERKRIAVDLHDNIGAYASAIKADIEKITALNPMHKDVQEQHLQNLQNNAQEIMDALRDTIWVLNKDNITITGISDRIKNYISKMRATYNNINFIIEEEITNDVPFNSQNALNIFRIVQEALHNALKHSTATIIKIVIKSTGSILLKIIDNGTGIKKEKSLHGNGLSNMQLRATEMGMHLTLLSKENEGTSIIVEGSTTN